MLTEYLATTFFALAVIHTFMVGRLQRIANSYPPGSLFENLFHLLGEVEVVFGLWAGIFILSFAALVHPVTAIDFAESLNFTEPLFVFAVMAVAATAPIVELSRKLIIASAKLVPRSGEIGIYLSCLIVGPLLGSLITEPASMTVTALILRDRYFGAERSSAFKYLTLAVLFVNVSIGGVLTHFAAPPVLMVAAKWNWDSAFMFTHFGWKAMIAVVINALLAAFVFRKEISSMTANLTSKSPAPIATSPYWLISLHLLFLAAIVAMAHHPVIFLGLFLFFIGVTAVTTEYQKPLKIKESLLVGFFLAGLVVLGTPQRWWLQPLLVQLNDFWLFVGTGALTAFTDNAALTFLGSQIEGITESQKYSLVAAAVGAGGMTVIANAPNPAGYSILRDRFGEDGIDPLRLAVFAAVPTLIALGAFYFLP